MEKLKSQVPDFQKEIQIQPIIYQNFQPVITKVIQPVINKKIQPVVHKEIQPIVDQEIQPVITKEIQPVITRKIQPVIFNENQTNIEEVIQQLEQSHKQNNTNIIEKHITNEELLNDLKEHYELLKNFIEKHIIQEEEDDNGKEINEDEEDRDFNYVDCSNLSTRIRKRCIDSVVFLLRVINYT